MYKIIAPLRVKKSKNKYFTLNLNVYRNTHYQSLNNAKKEYKRILQDDINLLPFFDKIEIIYVLFVASKRKTDIGNILSIHQKFFEDALSENGKIIDDNYLYIPRTEFIFGGIDKNNPRVEINIKSI